MWPTAIIMLSMATGNTGNNGNGSTEKLLRTLLISARKGVSHTQARVTLGI